MKAASGGYPPAVTEVDPNNYHPVDCVTHGTLSKIGEGCFRTHPVGNYDGGKMSNFDVVNVTDAAIRAWQRH